jgi:hypothetical protein
MKKPQKVNEVTIGIACPTYPEGATTFSAANPTNVAGTLYEKKWTFKQAFLKLYLTEYASEGGRTRYNQLFTCPK